MSTNKMAENVEGAVPALRVTQLDAAELDGEILHLLKSQLSKAFKYQQSSFLARYDPEVNALLRLILWKFTIHQRDATIGQQILNIKYKCKADSDWMTPKQRWFYAGILIGCPWLRDRSHDLMKVLQLEDWNDRVERSLQWLESALKVAALVNFVVFLRRGGYLSLAERLLGIRSMFPRKQLMRQVSFQFMTREILWHGFSEFLFFLLPLVNIQRIKNTILRWTLPPSAREHSRMERSQRHLQTCGFCGEWPIHPQEIGCVHIFCYFCIQSNYEADPGLTCPLCSKDIPDITAIHPVMITIQPNS